MFFLCIAIFALYFIKIADLQIVSGEKFRENAINNITLSYFVPPARGIIYDRQGKELAYNVPNFELIITSKDLPENRPELEEFTGKLGVLLDQPPEEIKNVINAQKGNALILLKSNLEKSLAIKISQADLTGVYVIPVPKRIYSDGRYFSHLIGYISKITPSDLKKDEYYKIQDKIGKSGIESFYEEILRGKHGILNFSKFVSIENLKQGAPGNSLVLSIDVRAQKQLYSSMEKILRSAGLNRGSAILQNPHSGAVIALVSFPSFDNNLFQNELTEKDVENLFQNKNKPLLNRAVSGLYSPGSTIKPLLALAGLKEKVISPETTITDHQGFITVKSQYDPSVVYTFRDWKIQGTVNLRKAIANSSDIYFYSVGGGYGKIAGLGLEKIIKYLKHFLADQLTNVDLPGEQAGFIPSESWKLQRTGESWYKGDTFNISIGQGDLAVTPIWLNTYISAIANGGFLFKPLVAQKVVDLNKKNIAIFEKEELGKLDFEDETINEIKAAMREAVVSGTGQLLARLPVPVAAKTGTAEVIKGKSANSLVTVFGPYHDPEFTLTVIVENINSNQQGMALQAARNFLEQYLQK